MPGRGEQFSGSVGQSSQVLWSVNGIRSIGVSGIVAKDRLRVRDEGLPVGVVSSRGRQIPRGVKRKISKFPLRPRHVSAAGPIDYKKCIKLLT